MTDPKREADLGDENLVVKRTKVVDKDKEHVKENEVLDVKVSERYGAVSPILNNINKGDFQQKLPSESLKNGLLAEGGSSSEDATSSSSEVQQQQVAKLYSIEADAAEDKGSRHSMEDAWVVLPNATLDNPGKLSFCRATIFSDVLILQFMMAMVVGWPLNMHRNICMPMFFQQDYHMDIKAAKKAVLEGFRRTDENLLQESAKGNWQDGATSVCVWILGQMVIVANIGDAKAVLARSSSSSGCQNLDETECPLKAIVITREHKAIYPQERGRIQKAGGFVGPNGRLQGRLEVSRAFGDRHFKKVGVIATPDVHSFELTEKEQFIILGCDGLWGVFGPSDAVDFVHKQLKDKSSVSTAARRLVKEAVRERRCKDNCTAIVIVFRKD